MGSDVGFSRGGCCQRRRGHHRVRRNGTAGRPHILAVLAQMAFGSGNCFGEMLAYKIGRETGPGGKEPSINGLDPCFENRAECTAMQVLNQVAFGGHLVGIVGCLERKDRSCPGNIDVVQASRWIFVVNDDSVAFD